MSTIWTTQEETYLKRKLAQFVEDLDFVDDVSPSEGVLNKQKKWFIDTRLLVESASKGKSHIIFGE